MSVQRAAELGLELNSEALGALPGPERASAQKLPQDHAAELLDAVAQKASRGEVKDASNYIVATISRGYVPRSGGGGKGHGGHSIGGGGGHGGGYGSGHGGGYGGGHSGGYGGHGYRAAQPGTKEYEQAATALINSVGMGKAEAVGLQLTDEAVQSLLTVPTSHASEILEAVAEKSSELRDPSNYVVATIRRGYVPRAERGSEPHQPHQPPQTMQRGYAGGYSSGFAGC
ncbi:unnamed protein product [Effrenium voratum]|nr:unnamed protein product [Effrenium voratum]